MKPEHKPETIPKQISDTCLKLGIACITSKVYIDFVVSEAEAKEYRVLKIRAEEIKTERDEHAGARTALEVQVANEKSQVNYLTRKDERSQVKIEKLETKIDTRVSPVILFGAGAGVGALAVGLIWFFLGRG